MVNELQEEKKMMEELVRSSMTPVSGPVTPQDELHIMEQQLEQPMEQQLEQPVEQQTVEQQLEQPVEQQTVEQQLEQPVEQPEEEPMEQPLTQQTPSQVPISAEDFFTQPAPAKSKSD